MNRLKIFENPAITFFLLMVLGIIVFTGKIGNNDTFLHIGIGKDLIAHGFHNEDPFSFTQKNTPYIDHEWLCQVILFALYNTTGVFGLYFFKLFCCLGVLMILYVLIPDKTKFVYYLPILLGLFLAYPHAQVRPHILAWLLAALLMLLVQKKKFQYIPILILFWANVHASFVLALFVFSVFLWIEYKALKSSKILLIWALSCLSPLINPYFYKIYFFLFEIKDYTHTVDEWQPFKPETAYFNAWILFCALLGLSFLLSTKTKALYFAMSLPLVFLGFSAMRHPIVVIIYLSPIIYENLKTSKSSLLKLKSSLISFIMLILIPGLWSFREKEQKFSFAIDQEALCIRASEVVKRHAIQGNMYNDYNFGGYLLWSLYPNNKVFIDGRLEVYGGQVIEDYYQISHADRGWEERLNQYAVDFLVIRPERQLAQMVIKNPRWELVYFDYNSVIYVRKGTNMSMRRLRAISPYGNRDGATPHQVVEEIRYLLQENPIFFGGYKILAFQYAKLGDLEQSRSALNQYLKLHPKGRENKEAQYLMQKIGLRPT